MHDRYQILMDYIYRWSVKTFPRATTFSRLKHLEKEIKELIDITQENPEINEKMLMEYADCFILILNSARSQGLSMEDIYQASVKKMEINEQRQWGIPDENGVVEHIRK